MTTRVPYSMTDAPVNVKSFGAKGDGVTNDTAAIQAALDAAAGKTLHFPAGTYLSGKLAVSAGTHITADASTVVVSAVTVATDHVFQAISTLGTATVLTANAAVRAISVAVTSASALAVGQLVCLRDTAYKFGTTGRNLEFNEIESIVGTTVTLKNRLIGSYTTANSAELVPVTTPKRDIVIENLYVQIPSTKDGGAFYFQDAYRCRLINCRSTGQKGQPGVQIWRSAYIDVQGGDFSDGQSQSTAGYGYGANIAQSSHHCVIRGATFRNVRECAVASNARYSGYVDCVSVGSYDNAFNAHADGAEDCFFIDCRSYSARSKGFYAGGVTSQAPDKRIRFVNCESHGSGYFGFWADGASGVVSEDILFENCKAYDFGGDTANSYGFYLFRSTRPRVINCIADAKGNANARAVVKAEICTDAVIRGGTFKSASSGWGIIHANCTGVAIDDNHISDVSSNQGVYAESTASTKVYVRRNRVDNDTPFTKNAGDIHEGNEFSTKRQQARGATASVADGGTITHGLVSTPTSVRAIASVSGEFVSVTAVSGTTFTLAIKKHDNSAGTTQTIYWEAEV